MPYKQTFKGKGIINQDLFKQFPEKKEIKTPYVEDKNKADKIRNELAYYSGTESYHQVSPFSNLKASDGIQYFRESTESYWLTDIVASVQNKSSIKSNSEFIVWKIEKYSDDSFKVTAWSDTPYKSKKLYEQEGEYTDFPLSDYEFYQEGDVLLLKREH
jgi:hypothetical protein